LPVIIGAIAALNKPASADPKNASGGKYIHRPKADISISNREEYPPTHWSLSFRQKKTHFTPPLTGWEPWDQISETASAS